MILTSWASTVLLLSITFSTKIGVAKCELYTSVDGMKQLVDTHAHLIEDLKGYINRQEKRLAKLKSQLKIFNEEHEKADKDVLRYVGNPIHAFTLIKRLSQDLNELQKDINEIVEEKSNVSLVHNDLLYPTQTDLEGVSESLVRIQEMNNLNLTDIVEGKLVDNRYRAMSTSDCYVVAKALYAIDAWEPAHQWMQQALRKYDAGDNLTSFTRSDIIDFIQFAHYQTGDVEGAARWLRLLLQEEPGAAQTQARSLLVHYGRVLAARDQAGITKQEFRKGDGELHEYLDNSYSELCQGELVLPPSVTKNLVCRWERARHPFLLLAPFKLEQLYLDPEVYLVHDAITDQEIRYFHNITTPLLKRSLIGGGRGGKEGTASSVRVSSFAWFNDKNVVARTISTRTADLTGLDMRSADKLQVSNYVVGGHYALHHDYYDLETLESIPALANYGNRIATVMFYLSDVEAGGATVFPRMGLSVFPKRGAALIWRNLHSSGEGNQLTEHAACPVVLGSKWVANKWIHVMGQELLAPCTLPYRGLDYKQHVPAAVPRTSIYP